MNITGLVRLAAGSGADGVTSGDVTFALAQTGANQEKHTQVITTDDGGEVLTIPTDILPASGSNILTNIGAMVVANLDESNIVQLSYNGGSDANFLASMFAEVKPKGAALWSPANMTGRTAIYARSRTAVCRIAVTAAQA